MALSSVVKSLTRRCSSLTYYNHVSNNDSSDGGKCLLRFKENALFDRDTMGILCDFFLDPVDDESEEKGVWTLVLVAMI